MLDATEFLEMTETAFRNGALTDQNSLCSAIGGANYLFSNLALDKWLQALSTATTNWFEKWPDPPYSEIKVVEQTLFLGPVSKPADINAVYTVFRLFYLSKLNPDSSSPDDLVEENLKIMVKDNLSRRELVFVTDWAGLNHKDCCVVDAVEMLGLGDHFLVVDDKRVAVNLDVKGALYCPTWIDAGFWVYWMPNWGANDDCGFARHLITGERGAKEWVCRAKDVQITAARVIRASRAGDYRRSKLPASYWNGVRQWILDGRTQLGRNSN